MIADESSPNLRRHRILEDSLPHVAGAVLTGGRSTRMGRDKAFIEVGGRPLAALAAAALREAGADEVVAVGGDLAALRAIGFDRAIPDLRPRAGPLGGILTALTDTEATVVAVLACDLPNITSAVVGQLVAAAEGHDAALARTDRLEPLVGAWHPSRCLGPLQDAFNVGVRAVHRALARLDIAPVDVDQRLLANANRPGDLPG
jgi:molybdopterin-guanine dinucleotide biosynthesis protein A